MEKGSLLQAVKQCLRGNEKKDRIFPFLWVHGEPHDRLQEELDAIYNCGLRAFCVESRPHPGFCEDSWWEDLGFILEYAKARDMQVWVLDDKHFPTGYANGAIEKKYPHLRRKCVRVVCMDVAGPMKEGCCLLPQLDGDEEVLYISAFRRTGVGEEVDGNSGKLLTDVQNGMVFWDVPEGVWRVYFVIRTNRGPAYFKNYIDMCDWDSCQVMVKEIYEPHYARFSEYFGNTFRGFFSDEPCFANNIGSFVDKLGTPLLNIPWREDMPALLAKESGISEEMATLLLPALWHTLTEHTAKFRLAYMNIITRLYRDNFSKMLGDWCQNHGVEYIGHVIEDGGAHMRLGYGSGHFFRALEGQHMSGMDIVLQQIAPGVTDMVHAYASASGKQADPDNYQFTIPKLATSAAHLDPEKQGRVMCELYGAFGWAEGVPEMKYLTDCMLSSGVNHLVPHAFSDKVEDPDCPPHFFNGGRNPQYIVFGKLMDYTAKLCHILSGGAPCVPVAVYYNAESEWCGGEVEPLHTIASILGRNYTDFDFVPMDNLMTAEESDGKLQVGGCCYQALLIPYSEVIPGPFAEKLQALEQAGVCVWYIDGRPQRTEAGDAVKLAGQVVQKKSLGQLIEENHWAAVKMDAYQSDLRVLRRTDGEDEIYFFFNASLHKKVDVNLQLKNVPSVVSYDGWHNACYGVEGSNGSYKLTLAPGQAVLWYVGDGVLPVDAVPEAWSECSVENVTVKLCRQGDVIVEEMHRWLPEKNYAKIYPQFDGVICYEFTCSGEKAAKWLQLTQVGETARLWVNGKDCGCAVRAPYEFYVGSAWQAGENRIRIEVAVNQAYGRRERFSNYCVLPPMGLFGKVLMA